MKSTSKSSRSGRRLLILASLAVAVPLALVVGVKKVRGSEPPGRLVVNADGTVTDTVTTLIWQQSFTAGGPGSTQASAATACASLSLGAHTSGWRLPTIKELLSIVDFESATSPMIDTAAFPGVELSHFNGGGTVTSGYVTSNTTLAVNFGNGQVAALGGPYRCVHSSP